MRKISDVEFVEKVEYEGGIADAILGYGLGADDLADPDSELAQFLAAHAGVIRLFKDMSHAYEAIADRILDDAELEARLNQKDPE